MLRYTYTDNLLLGLLDSGLLRLGWCNWNHWLYWEFDCNRSSHTDVGRWRSANWQICRWIIVALCVVAVAIGTLWEITLKINVIPVNTSTALMEVNTTIFANEVLFTEIRMRGKVESIDGALIP